MILDSKSRIKTSFMNEFPHLKNAPIKEALLDMRVEFEEKPSLEQLESIHAQIKTRYPSKSILSEGIVHVQIKQGESYPKVQQEGNITGYIFTTADEKQTVQVKKTGFTFNRLKQYQDWPAFRDEAQDLWNVYRTVVAPKSISRVALRYINRFELPLPLDLKDYLFTTPEISPKLPQGLAGFLMRLVIPDESKKAVSVVTQTIEAPTEDTIALIFDIDVFKEEKFDIDSREHWAAFEILHQFKNELFFYSLTTKCLELFNGPTSD